jgi:hypothetical protein
MTMASKLSMSPILLKRKASFMEIYYHHCRLKKVRCKERKIAKTHFLAKAKSLNETRIASERWLFSRA